LRVDNDFFAQRDEGYTSGLQLQAASADLPPGGDGACLDPIARWLQGGLGGWLRPGGAGEANLLYGIEQSIYTPHDGERRAADPNDRPYAGMLTVNLGFNLRDGDTLRSNELALGVVGPAAGGRRTQAFFHHVFGSDDFNGWPHQLDNEPVFMVRHQRAQRRAVGRITLFGSPLAWDSVTFWGAALGNLRTATDVGVELRLGRALPHDFGSNPARSGPEARPPGNGWRGRAPGFTWHGFLAVQGRWVLHDITLDGTTFRDGPSVGRRALVGDAALGFALRTGRWRIALARTYRSREFDGQHSPPSFGSVSLTRSF
jgi:hypothetical protein